MFEKIKIRIGLQFLDGMVSPGSNIRKLIVFRKIGNILQEEKTMETLERIKGLISGKKTYLLALGAVVGTVVAWTNGQVNDVDAIKQIWEALIATTIRAGISK